MLRSRSNDTARVPWTDRDVVIVRGSVGLGQGHPGTEHALASLEASGALARLAEHLASSQRSRRRELHRADDLGHVARHQSNVHTMSSGPAGGLRTADGLMAAAAAEPFHNAALLGPALQQLHDAVLDAASRDGIVVTVGGDHAVATASCAALSQRPGRMGVLWIDAHGDFNTPTTSPSGNFHGMPLAALCGQFPLHEVPGFGWFRSALRCRDVVVIGARALDDGEQEALRSAGIAVYSSSEVRARGGHAVAAEALADLRRRGVERLHLSFDIDALDGSLVPGTGTPEPDGLSLDDARALCAAARQSGMLASLDLTEINPMLEGLPVPSSRASSYPASPTLRAAEAILFAALAADKA